MRASEDKAGLHALPLPRHNWTHARATRPIRPSRAERPTTESGLDEQRGSLRVRRQRPCLGPMAQGCCGRVRNTAGRRSLSPAGQQSQHIGPTAQTNKASKGPTAHVGARAQSPARLPARGIMNYATLTSEPHDKPAAKPWRPLRVRRESRGGAWYTARRCR